MNAATRAAEEVAKAKKEMEMEKERLELELQMGEMKI